MHSYQLILPKIALSERKNDFFGIIERTCTNVTDSHAWGQTQHDGIGLAFRPMLIA